MNVPNWKQNIIFVWLDSTFGLPASPFTPSDFSVIVPHSGSARAARRRAAVFVGYCEGR